VGFFSSLVEIFMFGSSVFQAAWIKAEEEARRQATEEV
jgi:hypothetical protein